MLQFFLRFSASDITLYHCHRTLFMSCTHGFGFVDDLQRDELPHPQKAKIACTFVCWHVFVAGICVIYLISFYAIVFEIQHTMTSPPILVCVRVCNCAIFYNESNQINLWIQNMKANANHYPIIRRTVTLCLGSLFVFSSFALIFMNIMHNTDCELSTLYVRYNRSLDFTEPDDYVM